MYLSAEFVSSIVSRKCPTSGNKLKAARTQKKT